MKILILNPNQITRWNPGHQQFRNAIGNFHNCVYYGPGYKNHQNNNRNNHVPQILKYLNEFNSWYPDIILTYGYRYTLPFTGLNKLNIPKVHIVCDFTPPAPGWRGTRGEYILMMFEHNYDIYFTMSYQALHFLEKNVKRPVFFLPFGVDETIFKPMYLPKIYDAYIGWSHHNALYPMRRPIEKLARESGANILIKRIFNEGFVKIINSASVSVNTSNIFKTLNMKNFEVMACNKVLLTERVQEFDDLGFKPLVHYIDYKSAEQAIDRIKFLNKMPDVASAIAQNGYEKTVKWHTNNHRVVEMTRKIHETL